MSIQTAKLLKIITHLTAFFEGDDVRITRWLLLPNLNFGNSTPWDLIKNGHSDKVLLWVENAMDENKREDDRLLVQDVTARELIRHAACKTTEGAIFIGKSHGDCAEKMMAMSLEPSAKGPDGGFMTSKGRYVERAEAAALALLAKQIDTPTPYLFSEDLWSKQHGGKHHYDEIQGYVESRA